MDDTTLVFQILSRNKKALSQFYTAYLPILEKHVSQKVALKEDAEEIVSDTLYAFLEAVRDFTGKSSLKTFLFAICNHKIIDFYRRKKFKHVVFSRLPQLEALMSPLLTPEDVYDSRLTTEKIKKTLETLLPKYRAALLFKYAENLSVSDIASKLEVSLKSAECVLFRARKAFVKAFVSI